MISRRTRGYVNETKEMDNSLIFFAARIDPPTPALKLDHDQAVLADKGATSIADVRPAMDSADPQ